MGIEFRSFTDAAAMADAAARDIADALAAAIAARGRASLVGAGGRTPAAIYDRLANADLPWAQVWAMPGDERWVAPDHAASNQAMLMRALARGRAAAVHVVGLKTADATPAQGLGIVEQRIRALARPFDMVMLGMGTDGHTASLFPGAKGLDAALDPAATAYAAAITPEPLPPEAPFARATLTLRALLDARRIVLLLQGAAKKRVYEAALAGTDALAMPVRAVLHQDKVPVTVYYAD